MATSSQGVISSLDMTVAHDSVHGVIVKMGPDVTALTPKISNVAIVGTRLQWTQDVSGRSCKANALLTAATATNPATITGTMACEDGTMTFALRKTTG
jgi:hypothetical protein